MQNKKKFLNKSLLLIILFALLFCTGCHINENVPLNVVNDIKNQCFEIIDKSTSDEQKYEYVIYDKNGDVVYKEETIREPHVNILQDGLLEIVTVHGSSAQLYSYYDVDNDVFSSESFWNRTLVFDGKVVYMSLDEYDNDLVLIVRDIFDKDKYYKEIRRDFYKSAVPALALKDARILEDGNLEITYLKGVENEIVNEIVVL